MSPDLNLPPTFHFIPLLQAVTGTGGLSSLCHIANSHWLAIYFAYGNICFNGTLPICPPSPPSTPSTSLFSLSGSRILYH